ncbi:hypothetical protein RJ639_021103 [Escallonia herrerae]|uniref:Smr domain-containing protein n=1 Tax=Escallonia herrerae TaxID=1293975 RepID=A0AA88V5W6_9ASTE|nr:hypothetical protein RJ639_021103 [Escallonia herrerae]
MRGLQLSLPFSWNNQRSHQGQPPPRLPLVPQCALSKQGHRFLTSLATTSAAHDPSATNRLLRKFVASSSKSVALSALSHLLSPTTSHPHLSSLALPLYSMISEAAWFNWNPKLVADVIALLWKQDKINEAEALIDETALKLEFRERELCAFYCNLIDIHSKHKSKQGVFDSYSRLKRVLSHLSSIYLKRRAYESMIGGLCVIDLPQEAEKMMEEMKGGLGVKPSAFEFRSLVYAYGRLGLFADMRRSIMLMEVGGFELDTVCSNMVLSSLGVHNELLEMASWLGRMKDLGVPFSIRTYNSVLNSCSTIMSVVQDPRSLPLSIEELMEILDTDEALVVQKLIGSSVLIEVMEWKTSEMKLDLHGMHLGSAYLIVLQWFDELRSRFLARDEVVPAEIRVVCGAGKHSIVRGDSPVKGLVKEMMVRMKSPMRIDRKNIGCFIAKGRVMKDWLG